LTKLDKQSPTIANALTRRLIFQDSPTKTPANKVPAREHANPRYVFDVPRMGRPSMNTAPPSIGISQYPFIIHRPIIGEPFATIIKKSN
jgi:hypothetical protein